MKPYNILSVTLIITAILFQIYPLQILFASYNPGSQVQTDWNQGDSLAFDYIKNKPAASVPQVQADWSEGSTTLSDFVKNKPSAPAFSTSTRSITTSTGSSGFLVSSSRLAFVSYSISISTTATIGSSGAGYVVLEVSPTNSSSPSSWYSIGSQCRNDQTVSLAIVLQSTQTVGCSLSGFIPVGYYVKLRSVTVGGSPTFSFVAGSEVLLQ